MDVTQQVIDALLLPFAVFGGVLLLLLLLVLRLTYQTALLARRQKKMLAMLDDGKPPSLRRRRAKPDPSPAEPAVPADPAGKPPLLALPAIEDVPETAESETDPDPPSDATVEFDDSIEPIKVRRDAEFGVIYTFRGKDYLSRVAADQARWRSLNEPARGTRSEVG